MNPRETWRQMYVPAAAFLLFAVPLGLVAGPRELELEYCLPRLDSRAMRQNLSFNLVIEFSLSSEGIPEDVKVVRSLPIFEISDALECIKSWRLFGFEPNQKFLVVLYWRHGFGWTSLTIQSEDYSHRVRLNLNQYGCLPTRDSPTPAPEPTEPVSPK